VIREGRVIDELRYSRGAGKTLSGVPECYAPKPSSSLHFCTFTRLQQERVICHQNTYRPGSCSPTRQSDVIGYGPIGYID
jgi:hypothetical protein